MFSLFVIIFSFTNFIWAVPTDTHQHHQHDVKSEKIFHKISEAVDTLNFDLLQILHKENQNILISPFNVYAALVQSHLGAAGSTRNELADVLKIPKDDKHGNLLEIHDYIGKYIKHVTHGDHAGHNVPTIVKAANGIFVDKTVSIKPTYSEQLKSIYEGEAISTNFGDGKAAKDLINKWVSEKTNGRIPQVLSDDLDSSTRFIFASALYFAGRWKETFSVTSTNNEKFNIGTAEIDVQMMHNKKNVPYYNDPTLQFEAIQLGYEGDDYALSFILPYTTQTLANLTNHMNAAQIHRVFNESKDEGVDYKIPKIKFSNKRSLVQPLSNLGLKGIFEKADFSNMIAENTTPLAVSEILHATEIEIDEDGTKASAVTLQMVVGYALPIPPPNAKPFHLNRPFLMTLYHRSTCTILFCGFVYNPTA